MERDALVVALKSNRLGGEEEKEAIRKMANGDGIF